MIRKAGAVLAIMLAAVVSLLVFALPAQADTTTWHGVAEEMGGLLDKAVEQGKAGQPDDAVATVNSAYYDYYEKLGFEATVKTMVSGQQANSAEYEFTLIKRALSGGDMAGAEEHVGILKQMLLDQAEALEPGGSGPTAAGVLIQALVIILREGLEAIIVLGAIIAYLVKSGNRKKLWPVYGGALLALAASVGLAFAINAVTGLAGANQELVEGVTVLLAAGMLIWASNWVLSKSDAAAWTTYIKDKTGTSLKRSSLYSLAAVAFLAVFREGAETILLFQALRTQAGEHARQLGYGLAIGGVVLVGVYLAIRYLSVRLPIRPFFLGTSVLLAILAVSFAGSGVGELQEAGVVPLTQTPWPPAVDLLGIKPTFETLAAQVAILAVIVGLAIWSVSRTRRRAAQARAADAAPPSPEEGNATSPAPEDELNNPPSGSPGESGDQPVDQPVLDQGAGRDAAEAAPTPALIGADQVTKAREGAHQIEGVENPS